MRASRLIPVLGACCALGLGVAACGDDEESTGGSSGAGQSAQPNENLKGSIRIDGSSTVQPFAEAAAELFNEEAPEVKIVVGGAGTGDGFERFCRGETQISDASRPIEDDEQRACRKQNVDFSEVQVANDGVAVITNPELNVDCFSTDQLKKLLGPDAETRKLSDAGGGLPDVEASFFTPGPESGTFDFFTEAALETDAEQRQDNVQTSPDDNQIITGVAGTPGGVGYVGYSFAEANRQQLNIAAVDGGTGCVKPSLATIQDGEYKPLSRPIYMYPSRQALERPEVKAFMEFAVSEHETIARAAKMVPMTGPQAGSAEQALAQGAG